MRGGISYVEDSFKAESKDSVMIVKPFLITRKKVVREVRKALRNKTKEIILAEFKNKDLEEIFSDILSGSFQKSLSLRLKKIYPLAFCDIRVLKIEKRFENVKIEKVEERVQA